MLVNMIHRSFPVLILFCLFYTVVAEAQGSLPGSFPVADAETVVVSPDGSLILCAGKALTLYNLSGKKMWSESLPGDNYTLVSFAPGEIIFSRAGTGEVQFRSFKGEQLPGFKTKKDIVSLAVSRDGSLIATGEYEFGLTLWDRMGHAIRSFSGLTDEVSSLVFSPDGKTLASGGSWWSKSEAEIILWAVDGSSRLVLEERQHSGIHLEYTARNYLLSGSFQENKLILWDNLGKPLHTYSRDMEFGNQFVVCGDYIASIKRQDMDSSPGILQVWSIDGTFLETHTFPGETCRSLVAIPGTSRIVIGLINLSSGNRMLRFMDLNMYNHAVKLDQQGRVIFNIKDYIPEVTFEPLSPIPVKPGILPAGSFSSLAFSPDEKWGVAISYDKGPRLHLFRLTGDALKTFPADCAFLDDAFFSPSGEHLLVLGERISLWSAGGEVLASFPKEEQYLCAAFLKEDTFVAGTFLLGAKPEDTRGLLHFFNREGKELREPVKTEKPIYRLIADPQGIYFLGYGEQMVFLFRGDGTPLVTVEGFPGNLNSCTLLGSRQEILVFYDFGIGDASWCGVYDFTGKFLRRFKLADNDSPLRLAVSPDGNYIACRFVDRITVYSAFGTVVAGNLNPGESMESAIRFSPGGKYLGCAGYSTGEVLPLTIWELK